MILLLISTFQLADGGRSAQLLSERLDCASFGRLFQTTPLMPNDNIANCIAYFRRKCQDYSFRQLRPSWPPISAIGPPPIQAKFVVSNFQKPVCRALNAHAAAI